jgi:catechol 2,3-dioxygenase-like lactoylglutathione lyase family enzyme
MTTFPTPDTALTHILVVADPALSKPWSRCFFRDPDGHLFEISEYRPTR